MGKLLDTFFFNRKASLLTPIGVSILLYLLFILFNNSPDKSTYIIITPIISVVGFFGVFLVIFIQVRDSSCPKWFLNVFELLTIIVFGISTVVGIASFLISGFQNFSPILCLGVITWSSVSWAHSKRKTKS